jgi:flagellar biosynthesis/type III secretory pathway protein FliH
MTCSCQKNSTLRKQVVAVTRKLSLERAQLSFKVQADDMQLSEKQRSV